MIRDLHGPTRIDREAIYDEGAARAVLGVPAATLARARREGGLRYARHGARIVYLGEWILDWIRAAGEPTTPDRAPAQEAADAPR